MRLTKARMLTSWGRPFRTLEPVPLLFGIISNELKGLGLPYCSLSKSLNPWLGAIPATRNISVTKNSAYIDLSFYCVESNSQKLKIWTMSSKRSQDYHRTHYKKNMERKERIIKVDFRLPNITIKLMQTIHQNEFHISSLLAILLSSKRSINLTYSINSMCL